MTNKTAELLDVPTKARTKKEQELLDDILFDPELKDLNLKNRAKSYMQDQYDLVFWYHYNGITPSFEEIGDSSKTIKSYNQSTSFPKIVGFKKYEDLV